ncbi:MAG: PLP-dependent aminotransferase family protein [Deltaproteobacteria bacterium]|nr:PLP-dependent aminotransferase family protein [Deltaproteobacteria bacterium]
MATENKNINFLRGIPATESLLRIKEAVAQGYHQAIMNYGSEVLQYGHFNGFLPLRQVLAELHGVHPDQVIAGNGGMEVISLLFKSLPKGSIVAVEEATYDRVLSDISRYGLKAVGIPLTSEGLDVDVLKNLITKNSMALFYGIPFHQNPVGMTYSSENVRQVNKICSDNNVLCAWDICYWQLRYDGQVNQLIDFSEPHGPILFNSFTKTIAPGTKCGYCIASKKMVETLTPIIANTRLNPNLPTQAFIADFIKSGGFEAHLTYLAELYRPRMETLNREMADKFPEIKRAEVTGGFFLGFWLPGIKDDRAFVSAAEAAGLHITSSKSVFAPNILDQVKDQGFYLRIPYPALNPDDLAQGMTILRRVYSQFVN